MQTVQFAGRIFHLPLLGSVARIVIVMHHNTRMSHQTQRTCGTVFLHGFSVLYIGQDCTRVNFLVKTVTETIDKNKLRHLMKRLQNIDKSKLSSLSSSSALPRLLTHHGPVPHICVAIFSTYFPSAPNMGRWFQWSFPQCPISGALQTARSSAVPRIVVARPHLLSPQRPIYGARHGPLSLHVSCGKY